MDVNVVRSATIEEHSLLRDQLCFGQQKWLKGGGTIGSDPKLEAELVALIRGAGGAPPNTALV